MENNYDIIIVGGGPIGASTAYFLSQKTDKKILLLERGNKDDHVRTFEYAGGSIRWWWETEEKIKMTKATADFIKQKNSEGVDLSYHKDSYVFLNRGIQIPSINISGKKLADYFLKSSEDKGVEYKEEELKAIKKESNSYMITTDKGEYVGKKVLLALGTKTKDFVPALPIETEKRVLFVLDREVKGEMVSFPHVVMPFQKGIVFLFVKKFGSEYKIVVGQEDVIEHNDRWEEEDYFGKLMELGLGDHVPFLKDAKVEKILWGFDMKHKTPLIYTEDEMLYAVTCGSAIRSCAYIGEQIAKKLD